MGVAFFLSWKLDIKIMTMKKHYKVRLWVSTLVHYMVGSSCSQYLK